MSRTVSIFRSSFAASESMFIFATSVLPVAALITILFASAFPTFFSTALYTTFSGLYPSVAIRVILQFSILMSLFCSSVIFALSASSVYAANSIFEISSGRVTLHLTFAVIPPGIGFSMLTVTGFSPFIVNVTGIGFSAEASFVSRPSFLISAQSVTSDSGCGTSLSILILSALSFE